jgi:hypothetical protein
MSKQSAYEAMMKKWTDDAATGAKQTPEGFVEALVDIAADHLGEKNSAELQGPPAAEHLDWLEDLSAEVNALMRERGAKYGPGNIAQFGDYGVLVRLSDKLSRMQHSLEHDHADESVEDTWKDVIGYGLIGLAWSRGLWPGSENT